MNRDEILAVDKNLPMPLYFQLKESLRRRIVSKEWKPGAKIPTEAEICQLYNVSRITARKALEELQQDGYLDKKQGKGTFVRDNAIEQKLSKFYSFSEELKKRGLHESTKIIRFEAFVPEEKIAATLGLGQFQKTYCVSRIRLVDGNCYAFEQSYIPLHLAENLTQQMVSAGGLYRSLAALGVSVNAATESFRAINLDAATAGILGVQVGEAAISLLRIAYSGAEVVEYCNSIVIGDFFSYTVELK